MTPTPTGEPGMSADEQRLAEIRAYVAKYPTSGDEEDGRAFLLRLLDSRSAELEAARAEVAEQVAAVDAVKLGWAEEVNILRDELANQAALIERARVLIDAAFHPMDYLDESEQWLRDAGEGK